jgi:hypothetical protein
MVNTFYVHANPKITARVLDDRRTAKQRLEARQIINILLVLEKDPTAKPKWYNHPAVKMWIGYTFALMQYYNIMVKEWIKRGKNNTMELFDLSEIEEIVYPEWTTCEKVHYSHQARLIQKDPAFYTKVFSPPSKYLKLGYIWPSKWTPTQLRSLKIGELAEPYKEEHHCIAIKKNGEPCVNKALYEDKCGVHRDKTEAVVICSASYKNGKSCRYKAKKNGLCGIHAK